MIRPRGNPIPPNARSRESDPVPIPETVIEELSESFMIEPLPNAFSICPRAFPSILRSSDSEPSESSNDFADFALAITTSLKDLIGE